MKFKSTHFMESQLYANHLERQPRSFQVHTMAELYDLLAEHGIPLEDWTEGKLHSLYRRIKEGDIQLISDENEGFRQFTQAASITLYSHDGRSKLKEIQQDHFSFDDKYISTTRRDYNTSLGETKKIEETFLEAAYRGLYEELGIQDHLPLDYIGEKTIIKTNGIFPGLKNEQIVQYFAGVLPEKYYKSEGYTNTEPNYGYTKVRMEWREI